MVSSAKVITARKNGVVMVPRATIPSGIKEATVNVIVSGGQERRRVAFGVSDRNHVEISQGIRAGERFIVETAGR